MIVTAVEGLLGFAALVCEVSHLLLDLMADMSQFREQLGQDREVEYSREYVDVSLL